MMVVLVILYGQQSPQGNKFNGELELLLATANYHCCGVLARHLTYTHMVAVCEIAQDSTIKIKQLYCILRYLP